MNDRISIFLWIGAFFLVLEGVIHVLNADIDLISKGFAILIVAAFGLLLGLVLSHVTSNVHNASSGGEE